MRLYWRGAWDSLAALRVALFLLGFSQCACEVPLRHSVIFALSPLIYGLAFACSCSGQAVVTQHPFGGDLDCINSDGDSNPDTEAADTDELVLLDGDILDTTESANETDTDSPSDGDTELTHLKHHFRFGPVSSGISLLREGPSDGVQMTQLEDSLTLQQIASITDFAIFERIAMDVLRYSMSSTLD